MKSIEERGQHNIFEDSESDSWYLNVAWVCVDSLVAFSNAPGYF